jgi:undecaprenyl-diphosphatase
MEADAADYLRAILLGIVQAVTEFLPISSSGHLVLAPRLLGRETSSLTFDVGLHLGTMVAVIGYFWRDWFAIAAAGVHDIGRHGPRIGRWTSRSRLGLWIALGTVPAVLAGLLFADTIEERLREPWLVGTMLIAFGVVIGVADRWGAQMRRLLDMTAAGAFVVGIAQAIALVPGVSRSGITIAAGRGLGFDRPSAARFSFLLSAPVVFGAGALELSRALRGDEVIAWGPMVAGAVAAAVVGAFVIRGFLAFLQSRTLAIFVWYRIALGLLVLAAAAAGVL